MSPSHRILQRILIATGVLAILVAGYAALGFAGVPRILRSQATRFVHEKYGRTLRLGAIRFNPFTLELAISDFALPDADGSPMLAARRLDVQARLLQSIAHRGLTLASLTLEQPVVRVRMRGDGNLNLLDLTRPFPPRKSERPTPPPRFFLDHLLLSRGDVSYQDSRHPNLDSRLQQIQFELRDFDTLGTGPAGYEAGFVLQDGGRVRWQGSLDASPVASRGRFEVGAVRVSTLARLAGDALPVAIQSPAGVVGFSGAYDFTTAGGRVGLVLDLRALAVTDVGLQTRSGPADALHLARIGLQGLHFDLVRHAARLGEFKLDGATLRPVGANSDYVELPAIEVADTRVDLAGHKVQVAGVNVRGGDIRAWRDRRGINLMALAGRTAAAPRAARRMAGRQPAPVATGTGTAAPAVQPGAQAAWTVDVQQAAVRDLRVALEDRTVRPVARLGLTSLAIGITGLKWPLTDPLQIVAETDVDRAGHLAAQATASPSGAVRAHLDLRRFDLRAAQPYVAQFTALTLMSGELGSRLDIATGGRSALTVKGEVDVRRFRTIDDQMKRDLVKWDRLQVAGLDYRLRPARLAIRRVDARGLYARVILAENRTLNITEALHPAGAIRPSPVAAATSPATPGRSRRSGWLRRSSRTAAAPAPATTTARASTGSPLAISVGSIHIHDGSANYADRWIQPHFAIGIQQLEGEVDGISSDPASRARIELKGQVDRYAPAHIWGEANPLAATVFTDLHLDFTGIDLTSVNPYSEHFAGYRINKGKLTTQISYRIDNRKLDASHHVVIDQLELGDRVDSPDAVHLPMKLAVALLRDRHGVIDLDLPVTGSLDDPKFRIGPIIWHVFVNLIEKAVTAPFALLGHLFGGGEHVNQIAFQPGSVEVDAAARTQLGSIARGLAERPGLELDVPAVYTDLDAQALALRQLRVSLTGGRAAVVPAAAPGPAPGAQAADSAAAARDAAEAATVQGLLADPAQYFKRLVGAFRKQAGRKAPLPPAAAAIAAARPAAGAPPPDYAAANAALEAALLPQVKLNPARLANLGMRRARAVQDALLAGTGIAPGRVFVVRQPEQQATGGRVVLQLGIKQ